MGLPLHVATRVVAAAVCAVLLVAAPAGAVIGGTSDLDNELANVGVLQLKVGTNWFELCSGTLVALRRRPHRRALHRLPGGGGPGRLRAGRPADLVRSDTGRQLDLLHRRPHRRPPELAHGRPCFGNSKGACLSPGHEDIALIFLKDDVAGVTPAPIAGPGYLDTLNLKSTTFTVAGYGTDKYITGSAAAPNPIVLFDGIRSYRVVTAIPAKDAFPDRFFKITKSVCFGDSGGPLFHNGTVVAINTWTFSWRCDGPNLEYRVDSPIAQAFLDTHL